ncbi:hypothetical protein QJS10_CPB04g01485 [Acorus calamus]|uniref:Uncharacterized protein n=1 Tax=Acorus calamus TaxID=4465 RepID=A0AAV9EZY5_ACOCL|nr:hypothetical protein QJS10_CPB04g01485 [Acorus calamus]
MEAQRAAMVVEASWCGLLQAARPYCPQRPCEIESSSVIGGGSTHKKISQNPVMKGAEGQLMVSSGCMPNSGAEITQEFDAVETNDTTMRRRKGEEDELSHGAGKCLDSKLVVVMHESLEKEVLEARNSSKSLVDGESRLVISKHDTCRTGSICDFGCALVKGDCHIESGGDDGKENVATNTLMPLSVHCREAQKLKESTNISASQVVDGKYISRIERLIGSTGGI